MRGGKMDLVKLRCRFKELIQSPEITSEEREVYRIAIKLVPELWNYPSMLMQKIHEIEREIKRRRQIQDGSCAITHQ
jgi:hypothetical protein